MDRLENVALDGVNFAEKEAGFGLSLLNNEYVFVVVVSLLALYGANAKVTLPDYIRKLFQNSIFRVVFLSTLLVYNFKKSPQVAVIVSLAFLLTMHYLNQMEIEENFELVEAFAVSKQNERTVRHN